MSLSTKKPPNPRNQATANTTRTPGVAAGGQFSGPSHIHSPAPESSRSASPAEPTRSDSRPFGGTACGSRSTRPTGVR